VIEQVHFSNVEPPANGQTSLLPGWTAGPLPEQLESDTPPPEETAPPEQTGSWLGSLVKEVLQVVLPAIFLALAIHIFLAQATVVYGLSMQPNLQPTERLVIEKASYYFDDPQRSDIVVLDLPQMANLLIKRVVGLPGETLEIRRGVVLINGQALDEPFVLLPDSTTYGPITLGPDSYFVMGDNRSNSNDSRAFGPVHRNAIVGRAWLRYWPLDRFIIFD